MYHGLWLYLYFRETRLVLPMHGQPGASRCLAVGQNTSGHSRACP